MKVRIKNNELRLRINKEENDSLQTNEIITTAVNMATGSLIFDLMVNSEQTEEITTINQNGYVKCSINSFMYEELQTNPAKGLTFKNDIKVVIEVDLK